MHRHRHLSKQGFLERAFTFAFRGLVYAQIWEDPEVDMEALEIAPDSHVVTIASGGCNVLSYLTANPAKITAVDLNTAHIALNRLKLTAAKALPDHASFHRFFARADSKDNIAAYRRFVAPHLDEATRRYWEGRDLIGRRRIGGFSRGIYRHGLLGRFIGAAHWLARLHGVDPRRMLEAQSRDEQRAIFERELSPIFDSAFTRWLTSQPASLFGLGIPPAQFEALAGEERMNEVLKARLEKLACDFDLKDNYFAVQAFGRGYAGGEGPLPPYLQAANHEAVVERVGRVDVRHVNFTDFLASQPAASADRYVLLDAQDWMSDAQLNALWAQITRTARPGARVLFRTAGEATILPGRVSQAVLSRWSYSAEASQGYTARDRSAIYGGVHLYRLKGEEA
ncbi:S-adenosylmethionine--diacylglycerol 3-amino-3-carboxypropyl transferase [Sphingobium cloacae]|uniref:S-adenosylmethionine--diacylglycerol 3-amino-3-carboxypropyl transferase n=1 Tax=Sphingobium cloacae TaxID=120107 RepID=A0A1E1F0D9_9SPHN|nr:S-adenosylmethionine--diacylglycerol 3-amino-3-carboxypropyl transferase [Sphingobium cloacae]